MTEPLKPYTRPEPTDDEMKSCNRMAIKALLTKGREASILFITQVLAENIRLTKEVNAHRATLGYEPLPIFDDKGNQVTGP